NQLRIECQQSIGLFRVAARSGLPLDEGASAIQLPNGIDEGDELVLAGKRPYKLDLQVAAGLANAHAIVLTEAVEQLNALLEHAIPAIAMRVFQLLILIELPFLKQGSRRVLAQKEGGHSPCKGASEQHRFPGV